MRSLETLRRQLATLGPSALELLPTLDALEREFELRAQRIAALATASRLSSALADGGDATPLLGRVLMATLALTRGERSLIAVADPAAPGHRVVARRGADGDAPGVAAVIGAALRGDHRLLVPGLDGARRDERLLIASFRSAMASPIMAAGAVVGCLYVDARGPEPAFGEADFDTFRVFARHISPALALALPPATP